MEKGKLLEGTSYSPGISHRNESKKNPQRTRKDIAKVCYVEGSKPISLSEFSKKNDFPSVLKVNDGQATLSHSFSFGSDQGLIRMGPVTIPLGVDRMFVALEKKLVEVATCKDLASKRTYTVPLKSGGIEVVPLHSTEWQGKRRAFELREFLDSRSLPKVVRAMKDFVTTKGTAVYAGELLFPQEVKKRKKDVQKRILLAKVEDGSTVELTAASGLHRTFSIDSSDIQISLVLAAQCCKLPFACTMQSSVDETLQSFKVNVERVDKSEVISGIMKITEGSIQDDIDSCQPVYEVPVNLDLKVTVMEAKVEEVDINTVHALTSGPSPSDQQLYANVIAIKRTASINSSESEDGTLPSELADLLESGDQKMKVNVADSYLPQLCSIPSFISDSPLLSKPSSSVEVTNSDQQLTVSKGNAVNREEQQFASLVEEEDSFDSSNASEHAYSSVDEEEHQYSSIEEEPEYEYTNVEREHSSDLNNEYTYISAESDRDLSDDDYDTVRVRTRSNVSGGKPDEVVHDCTTAMTPQLRSLDVTGILHLLDAMNLGMYKESFKEAMIDGNVFSRLTDNQLSQLGVKLSLHRLRLLRIVKGTDTIEGILNATKPISQDGKNPQTAHVVGDRTDFDNDRSRILGDHKQAIYGKECDRKECQQQTNTQNEPPREDEVDTAVGVSEDIYDVPNQAQYVRPLVKRYVTRPGFESDVYDVPRQTAESVSDSETYDIPRNTHAKTSPLTNVHGTSTIANLGWHLNTSDPEIYKTPRPSASNRTNTVSSLISKFEASRVVCGPQLDKDPHVKNHQQ